jgi:hypothetical protein
MQERNRRTDGRTDERMDKRTVGQADRQTDGRQTDRQTDKALKKFSVSRNFENKLSGTNFSSRNSGTKLKIIPVPVPKNGNGKIKKLSRYRKHRCTQGGERGSSFTP